MSINCISLTKERVIEMIKIAIEEPRFTDSPSRCFNLPYVVAEAFCIESKHIFNIVFPQNVNHDVLEALMRFVEVSDELSLNPTLCGYFNKIISFFLIKAPNQMVDYLSADTDRYMNIVKHIYLNTTMVDVVIRICAVQGLDAEKYEKIDEIRVEILQTLSNSLEHIDDRFMTE